MGSKPSTAEKILAAGRQLFNEKGYAAASMSDIAGAVGISKGNLTYHFPTKRDLADQLIANTRQLANDRRRNLQPGDIADDYVEHLLFGMDLIWHNRFIFRDRVEFAEELSQKNSELNANFGELGTLIKRIDAAGMFRQGAVADLSVLTRSVWIVSRYWMDHLREFEGLETIRWADQEAGIRQHFAVLMPCLISSARKRFEAALTRCAKQGTAEN